MSKEDIVDTPLFPEKVKDRELYSLSLIIDEMDKKISSMAGNLEKVNKSYEQLENKNRVMIDSVSDIRLVGDELSKLSGTEQDRQVIINSVEFTTIIDALRPVIEGTVSRYMKELVGDVSNGLKESLRELRREQGQVERYVVDIGNSTIDLKKDLIQKSNELMTTRESISYLTSYLEDFNREIRKIYPKISVKSRLRAKEEDAIEARKAKEAKIQEQKNIRENTKIVKKKIMKKKEPIELGKLSLFFVRLGL